MAYIYQITNDINGKIYIGKTQFSIEQRFKEHCKNIYREECKDRPLYRAMIKYGIDHFHIELLEETDYPEERERFWIEEKGSFKYGYNATIGGDGRPYLDYDLLIEAYKQTNSLTEVQSLYGCDTHYLSKILKSRNIEVKSSAQVNLDKYGTLINQYDLQGNYIQTFNSMHAAAKYLGKSGVSHISDACKGKRKTAYGYKWQYAT